MENDLRKRIVRAAVAWERAKHEKMAPNQYRDMASEEDELASSVQAYNAQLLQDDVGEDPK